MILTSSPSQLNEGKGDVYYILIETINGFPSEVTIEKDPEILFNISKFQAYGAAIKTEEDPIFIIGRILDPEVLPWDVEEQTIWVIGEWIDGCTIWESFFNMEAVTDFIEDLLIENKIASVDDISVISGESLDWPPDLTLETIPYNFDEDMSLMELCGV